MVVYNTVPKTVQNPNFLVVFRQKNEIKLVTRTNVIVKTETNDMTS